jgi:hypothetical protein
MGDSADVMLQFVDINVTSPASVPPGFCTLMYARNGPNTCEYPAMGIVRPYQLLPDSSPINWVVVSPDMSLLTSCHQSGKMHMWVTPQFNFGVAGHVAKVSPLLSLDVGAEPKMARYFPGFYGLAGFTDTEVHVWVRRLLDTTPTGS